MAEIALGDIVTANIPTPEGEDQGYSRPCLVIAEPDENGEILVAAISTSLHGEWPESWIALPHRYGQGHQATTLNRRSAVKLEWTCRLNVSEVVRRGYAPARCMWQVQEYLNSQAE